MFLSRRPVYRYLDLILCTASGYVPGLSSEPLLPEILAKIPSLLDVSKLVSPLSNSHTVYLLSKLKEKLRKLVREFLCSPFPSDS